MEETRNWVEMLDDIMGGMILQRLDAVEILTSAQRVRTTWRRICKDPAMWKIVDFDYSSSVWYKNKDLEKLCKQAVHRSCGELVDIRLKYFVIDDLLDFISRCSTKLNHLCLMSCYNITSGGLNNAVKRLPHLVTLELSYTSICVEDIEVIRRNCPQLKSFTVKTGSAGGGDGPPASALCRLKQLVKAAFTLTYIWGRDGLGNILSDLGFQHVGDPGLRPGTCFTEVKREGFLFLLVEVVEFDHGEIGSLHSGSSYASLVPLNFKA